MLRSRCSISGADRVSTTDEIGDAGPSERTKEDQLQDVDDRGGVERVRVAFIRADFTPETVSGLPVGATDGLLADTTGTALDLSCGAIVN